MPNTLAHLGLGGFLTRSVIRNSDIKWIYLACIIPDIPWMFMRFIEFFFPSKSTYDLKLYTVIQASLFFSIILSLAISFFSTRYFRSSLILIFGSFIHLFFDAFQIKWGTGSHFLLPFDWSIVYFGFFWPESIPTYLITIFGLIFAAFTLKQTINAPTELCWPTGGKIPLLIFFIFLYLIWPLFLMDKAEETNIRSIKVMRGKESRIGKEVSYNRENYIYNESGESFLHYAEGKFLIKGIELNKSVSISVKGRFISENAIEVSDYKIHTKGARELSSISGLFLVFSIWCWILLKKVLETSLSRKVLGLRFDY